MTSNSAPPPATTTANVVPLGERRRPGRPRSIGRAPDEFEREQHRRVAEKLEEFVVADPLVRSTSTPADRKSTATIEAAMLEIARESAALAWEARQARARGRPEAEKSSSRRISGLATLAGLLLDRARAGVEDRVDPFDPRVQKLVALFCEQMREAAAEVLDPEVAARFVTRYEERMLGWESRVE